MPPRKRRWRNGKAVCARCTRLAAVREDGYVYAVCGLHMAVSCRSEADRQASARRRYQTWLNGGPEPNAPRTHLRRPLTPPGMSAGILFDVAPPDETACGKDGDSLLYADATAEVTCAACRQTNVYLACVRAGR